MLSISLKIKYFVSLIDIPPTKSKANSCTMTEIFLSYKTSQFHLHLRLIPHSFVKEALHFPKWQNKQNCFTFAGLNSRGDLKKKKKNKHASVVVNINLNDCGHLKNMISCGPFGNFSFQCREKLNHPQSPHK